MADGYSRVTNTPGVCIAQNGPGITNFVTGVAAAYWAHSPVVVITPETGSLGLGLGGFQELSQLPTFSEITKYQAHVSSPKRMAELTNRCFHYAMLERGPTQLNIPRDMFYGSLDTTIPAPVRVERSAGGPESLRQAAALLAGAENPVIVAGGGVVMGAATHSLVRLAEMLQVYHLSSVFTREITKQQINEKSITSFCSWIFRFRFGVPGSCLLYLPSQRLFPIRPSVVARTAGLPGQQGRHEHDLKGGRSTRAWNKTRTLRGPAAVRLRLLAGRG